MSCVKSTNVSSRDSKTTDPEGAIFSVLQAEEHPALAISDLLALLAEEGLDEAATKATLTRLLAEGKVEMTPERRLRIPIRGRL